MLRGDWHHGQDARVAALKLRAVHEGPVAVHLRLLPVRLDVDLITEVAAEDLVAAHADPEDQVLLAGQKAEHQSLASAQFVAQLDCRVGLRLIVVLVGEAHVERAAELLANNNLDNRLLVAVGDEVEPCAVEQPGGEHMVEAAQSSR